MKYLKNKKLIVLLHLMLIFTAFLSPLFIPWQLIGIIIFLTFVFRLLNHGQYNCLLSKWQFGKIEDEKGFLWYYLNKYGIKLSPRQITVIAGFIAPTLLLVLAWFIQRQ